MQYPEVLNNDQLIPGKWYWVTDKSSEPQTKEPSFSMHKVVQDTNDSKGAAKAVMFGSMSMWCHEGNSQFIERYKAYGPIVEPSMFGVNDESDQKI